MKKAILFGASGLVGSHLLRELLNDADYEQVTVVVRKNLSIHHSKLKMLTGDLTTLPGLQEKIDADEIFIALGTTKKNTPDQREYYQVDHDYPVLAAKLAKEKGAKAVFMVSSVGANAASSVFYIKTKGETERDILELDFHHSHIFRPSMIMGNRKEQRPMEKFLVKTFSVINPALVGKRLKKFRGIQAETIARAMIHAAKKPAGKVKIYHWDEMSHLS